MSRGHVSRAVRQLASTGLGNLGDERILTQLRSKHPARKEPIDEVDLASPPRPRICVSVRSAVPRLDEAAAPGISGFRNSYLKALAYDFADPRALETMDLLDEFAVSYANAELPEWFYLEFSMIRLVAPIKP
eukprot:12386823-Karenia_brevis.AAC.1